MGEVLVRYGDSASDTAVLLLDAAEAADLPADVVRSVEGGFYVDEALAKKAGVDYESDEDQPAQTAPSPTKKAAPRKAAKKAPAKRTSRRK